MIRLTQMRLRSQVDEVFVRRNMKGRLLTSSEYDILLAGPTRVFTPKGAHLITYLPGVLEERASAFFDRLHVIRRPNRARTLAAGGGRHVVGTRYTASKDFLSTPVGYLDAGVKGDKRSEAECRLATWSGRNVDQFHDLFPLFEAVGALAKEYTPQAWRRQMDMVEKTPAEFVIRGTPFTTVTVNHDHPTGMHKDEGDLPTGISCLMYLRRGNWSGGELVFPSFRLAVTPGHGDLLLMDAHAWHGNVDLENFDPDRGDARTSLVLFYRTKMADCEATGEGAGGG